MLPFICTQTIKEIPPPKFFSNVYSVVEKWRKLRLVIIFYIIMLSICMHIYYFVFCIVQTV